MSKAIYAVGTMDTKGHELAYITERIRAAGGTPVLVDVGTNERAQVPADFTREAVAAFHPQGKNAALGHRDRGQAVTAMSEALQVFLLHEFEQGRVAGVVGIGGTGGTALISPALRALPIGLPKVLVSTVASGNTSPYVGTSDFAMMNSVVDVAGLNRVSRQVLGNAAHAIVGMAAHDVLSGENKPTVGMTMFGVTTPCVTQVREALETAGWDCLVFHATGAGGQAMEKLAASALIEALLDLTTTEVADEVVGGVFKAGSQRFDLLAQREIPCVMSLGALDMVNFGAIETVPEQFSQRNLHVHNAQVTLMRTTPDENREFARWMAPKLNRSLAPLTLLIPEKGVSLLDAPGQAFYDPEADAALFEELEKLVEQTDQRHIVRLPYHINDAEFARATVQEFQELMSTFSPS
jgi:uncharacterized protein (UPF0261 family)